MASSVPGRPLSTPNASMHLGPAGSQGLLLYSKKMPEQSPPEYSRPQEADPQSPRQEPQLEGEAAEPGSDLTPRATALGAAFLVSLMLLVIIGVIVVLVTLGSLSVN